MSECNHVTLKKQLVGGQHWYACTNCDQKFKAALWDGKVTVTYPAGQTEAARKG